MSPWPSSPWSASTRPIRRPQTFYNALPQFGVISEPGLELSALRTAGVRTCNSGDRIPLEGATWRTPLPSIQSHPICYVTLRLEVMGIGPGIEGCGTGVAVNNNHGRRGWEKLSHAA